MLYSGTCTLMQVRNLRCNNPTNKEALWHMKPFFWKNKVVSLCSP